MMAACQPPRTGADGRHQNKLTSRPGCRGMGVVGGMLAGREGCQLSSMMRKSCRPAGRQARLYLLLH